MVKIGDRAALPRANTLVELTRPDTASKPNSWCWRRSITPSRLRAGGVEVGIPEYPRRGGGVKAADRGERYDS